MSIGVVIPTYNRRNNLVYTLQSLGWQTRQDFHVVVADDGSTDGTRTMVEQLMQEPPWQGRLRWVGCGQNIGQRSGRARNIGAANLPEECTFMIMLDSDLILNTDVIDRYAQAHAQYPTAVIMGGADWLPPLAFSEISQILQEGGVEALRLKVPKTPPRRIEGTFVGSRIRDGVFDPAHPLRPISPMRGAVTNLGYPLHGFRELEGFDEAMVGYGYEGLELGVRAHKKGIPCFWHSQIGSLHIWHSKGDVEERRIECERNLDYVIRKHGLNDESLEAVIDWSYWGHYHRLRGGQITCVDNELWAINSRGTHRIPLPSLDWLKRLGVVLVDDIKYVNSAEEMAHIPIAMPRTWCNVLE